MSDEDYLGRFERLEIPGHAFRHSDHIRVAWHYLCGRDLAEGAAEFVTRFRRYVRHIGAEAKYHETITWFYLVEVHRRLRLHPVESWEDFAAQNPDLLDRTMPLLGSRYRRETLDDPLARRVFVLPDIGTPGSSHLRHSPAKQPTPPFSR